MEALQQYHFPSFQLQHEFSKLPLEGCLVESNIVLP